MAKVTCINRNILECKYGKFKFLTSWCPGINRNILECKSFEGNETAWMVVSRINRNILECKYIKRRERHLEKRLSINRNILECK